MRESYVGFTMKSYFYLKSLIFHLILASSSIPNSKHFQTHPQTHTKTTRKEPTMSSATLEKRVPATCVCHLIRHFCMDYRCDKLVETLELSCKGRGGQLCLNYRTLKITYKRRCAECEVWRQEVDAKYAAADAEKKREIEEWKRREDERIEKEGCRVM